MSQEQFARTLLLLGKPAMDTLASARVAVFGVGGVGGYAVEVLARSGVGEIDLFDNDRVSITNINRQIYALHSTIGRYKVDVAAERIHDINRSCVVHRYPVFYLPKNADEIDLTVYDYVVDCIDTVSAKVELIRRCYDLQIPLICSLGAANKLDATGFQIGDIYETQMDPLAKIIRKKLRKLEIPHLKVVYSREQPLPPLITPEEKSTGSRQVPASNAFVPAVAGMIIGGEVVKDLINRASTMRIPVEGDRDLLCHCSSQEENGIHGDTDAGKQQSEE